VQPPNQDPVSAEVVYFDPDVDVAVLRVPGLALAPLVFRDDAARDAEGAVVGYPNDGPLRIDEARIRGEQVLVGQNIYGADRVTRTVVSVRGTVRSGNSGGPLVADDGRVYGVVFATSLTDGETGYALAVDEVQDALVDGGTATEPVSTGGCR
jgi:S1-C subfamily serine protease